MNDVFESIATIIGSIAIFFLTIIFVPFICFWFAYFGGWICSLVIGDVLANGLNQLFHTTHFTKELIPLCAATLGWIGGYFKSRVTTHTHKN